MSALPSPNIDRAEDATSQRSSFGRVLAIIPAYNEGANLPRLVQELRSRNPLLDILVIDDGSTDNTKSILPGLMVRFVSLPCNLGVGGAVQTGLLIALEENYDIAIQVDGDGQHLPSEIPKLLSHMQNTHYDMVLGSRFLGIKSHRSTLARRLGISFFSWLLSALCRTRFTDATSGFRAWSRHAIKVLARDYPEDYPEVEAILMLHRAGLRMGEIPVEMAERTAGSSTIGTAEAVTFMVKVPLAILMSILRGSGHNKGGV